MIKFTYIPEESDPNDDIYAVQSSEDDIIGYLTEKELMEAQESGIIIDGLPQEVKLLVKSKNLKDARKGKNDEFYTQLSDIEKELMNYDPAIFKDKVIYCPTDVAYAQGRILPSEFVHYFQMNARRLGFRKLIATCLAEKVDNNDVVYNRYEFTRRLEPVCDPDSPEYNPDRLNHFTENLPDRVTYYDEDGNVFWDTDDIKIDTVRDALKKQMEENKENYEYERIRMKRMNVQGMSLESKYIIDIKISECKPDPDGTYDSGDFRSKECIEILKEADIVVTNPPFSLFREFMRVLVEHSKKFLIIGNMNSVTYKEIFPLIKDNKVWYGSSIHSGDRKFGVPEDYPLEAAGCGVDETGQRYIRVKGVRWFTNLDYSSRHEDLILYKKYYKEDGVTPLENSESVYPKYDNYDAINVDKTKEIPCDYYGIIGAPITFLDKYNPEQFEIVGGFNGHSCPHEEGGYVPSEITEYVDKNGKVKKWNGPTIKRKTTYYRVCIRRK